MPKILILCFFALLAGFINSIVGGGGLVQLPVLMLAFPGLPLATVFGTNKMASIAGTSMATFQYSRRLHIDWKIALPTAAAALACSYLGAQVVSRLRADLLKPVIIVLLLAIAFYIFFKEDFGSTQARSRDNPLLPWVGLAAGAALGFYDGFFGPGTGSFLIFVFIGAFGLTFLRATAAAKVVNFATNLGALVYFLASGPIIFQAAIPMAACNVLGAVLGSRLAVLKGNRFVRVLFLAVVLGVVLRLAYDLIQF